MKTRKPILFASVSALLTIPGAVEAVNFNWTGTTGNWESAANWDAGVPGGGGGNFAFINNGGTVNINGDTNSIQDAFVGSGAGTSGTVNQLAGAHNNVGWMFIGEQGGTGSWTMSGNSSISTGRIYIGGRRDVTGGGTGTLTVNSTGTVTATSDFAIGTKGGSGTLNMNSGTLNAAHWMIIGETIQDVGGSNGVVNQTGGVVTNAATDANGRFWMGSLEGGANISSTATYNLSGGTLNARNASIGRHYIGNFNQTGGIANITAALDETNIGQNAGSTGTYVLSAGTLNATGGNFNVGNAGTGVLTVSGTGVANIMGTGGIRMAVAGTGNGTLNLNGGGRISAELIQRVAGNAQVNLNGGTLQARANNGDYFAGFSAAQINLQAGGVTFDTNGSSVTITQDLAGAGGVTKTGNGTLSFSGAPNYAGPTVINGGTVSVGNGGNTGSLPATGVTIAGAGALGFNRSDDLTNSLVVTGTGSIAQNGSNTLTLGAGLGGFTGTVNVNNGRLANAAAGSIATAALSVNSGGTLLPLGNAVGAIQTTGLTVGAGSTLNFDFNAGGATHDQIISSGGINFQGAYTINLFQVGTSNAFSDNGTYSLFDYATSVTGSPAGFTIGNAVFGKSYQLGNNVGDTTVRMVINDAILVFWNQSGGGQWTTNTNWSPNTVPNVALAEVNFGAAITAPSTVDLNGNKTAGRLTFDNANTYTIGGSGTLLLDNGLAAGSITVANGNHLINTPVSLPNPTTVSTATGTSLQVGDLSGAGTVTKTGNGTLVLNGTTGSTGGLIVSSGLVQVGNGGASGALPTGNVSLAAGTRLSLNSTGTLTIANNISGAGVLSQDAAGNVTHTGNSTYTGVTDLNVGTFNNSGSIVGTSGIDINNTTNLNAGSTTSTTGTINLGTGGTLTMNGASTASATGGVNVGAGGAVALNSGSTLTTPNAINVTGGAVNAGAGSTMNTSNAINVGAGGTLTSTGNTTLFSRLTLNGGAIATINGGNFRQTQVANETGFYVGQNSPGTLNITGGVASAYEVWVGRDGGGAGTINMSGGRLDANQWTSMATVGGSSGVINHTGGTINQNHTDWFSVAEGGTATYTMSGNALLNDPAVVNTTDRGTNKGNIVVGRNGGSIGEWTMNDNAKANIRRLVVGAAGNAVGTANFNGNSSIVSSEDFHIGETGTGTVNLNGGSLTTVSGWTQVGIAANSSGTLNVAAGLTSAREFRIGVDGTGVVNVSGGTLTATQTVTVGVNAPGTGTLTVAGTGTANLQVDASIGGAGKGTLNVADNAVLNVSGNMFIGNGGANGGVANISGGTTTVNGLMTVGNGGTGQGKVSVSGGNTSVGELWVGQAVGGNGLMEISAGTVSTNNWMAVGRAGATGEIRLSDTGNLVKLGANHVILGSLAGVGTFNQTGGNYTTVGAGETILGENAGGQGTWNISGGTGSTDALRVGWLNGGAGNVNILGTANLNVGAGGIIVSDGGPGTVIQAGGTTRVDGDIHMAIQGVSNGAFTLAGGTLDLTNGNVNFGPGISSFSYADGVLRGLANFRRALTQGGGLFEVGGVTGAGGLTTIEGDFTQDAGTLALELAPGAIGDVLAVNGLVSVSGGLDLTSGALGLGETFVIVQNDGVDPINGIFAGLPDGQNFTDGGVVFQIDYTGGDGNDIAVQVVPEPATGLALLTGLGVLAGRRRRKS